MCTRRCSLTVQTGMSISGMRWFKEECKHESDHVMHEKVHAGAWSLPRAIQAGKAISDSIHALQQRALELKAVQIRCHRLLTQVYESLHDRHQSLVNDIMKIGRALHPRHEENEVEKLRLAHIMTTVSVPKSSSELLICLAVRNHDPARETAMKLQMSLGDVP